MRNVPYRCVVFATSSKEIQYGVKMGSMPYAALLLFLLAYFTAGISYTYRIIFGSFGSPMWTLCLGQTQKLLAIQSCAVKLRMPPLDKKSYQI